MTLDATVGGSSSDSYITVADADTYAAARLDGRFTGPWTALTGGGGTTTKEKALKQATVDIDAFVQHAPPWSTSQALLFPRGVAGFLGGPGSSAGGGDVDPVTGDPFIPKEVRRACFEQATFLVANAPLMDDAATRRARGMISFAEENVSGTMSVDPTFGALCPAAEKLLRSVLVTRKAFAGSVRTPSGPVVDYDRTLDPFWGGRW